MGIARIIRIIRVRHILLRHRTQIHNRIRDAVCSPERNYNPWSLTSRAVDTVIYCNVTATVRHYGAGIECIDEFKGGEIGASRCAEERLRYARHAYTVGYVYYPRKLFEFPEERHGDIAVPLRVGLEAFLGRGGV